MAIEWENGFVKRISLGGLTGADWGIRVQDGGSWFTLDRAAGCTINDRGCDSLPNGFRRSLELVMAEGVWRLTLDATSWRGTVTIRQRLQSLISSRLVRMAIDLRFDPRSFDRALVGEQAMTSGDPAIWYHGTAPCLTLAGIRGMACIRASSGNDRLTQRVGVRLEPEGWIIRTECSPRHVDDPLTAIAAGETIDLSVECELWAAKPEFAAGTPALLQLA